MAGYTGKLKDIRFELESEFVKSFCDLVKEKPDPKAIVEFSKSCYVRELTKVSSIAVPSLQVNRYWKNMNKRAHLE